LAQVKRFSNLRKNRFLDFGASRQQVDGFVLQYQTRQEDLFALDCARPAQATMLQQAYR
jgi:hypothetical protein